MSEQPLNRRTLAKGMAWSVPVIAVSTLAPAVAASPTVELEVFGRGSWNRTWNDSRSDGYKTFKFYTTAPDSPQPAPGLWLNNTTAGMTISKASVTYYIPYREDIIFYTGSPGRNGWSPLTADYTKDTKYYRGVTYYPFTTTYSSSVVAQDGRTYLPSYAFESQSNVTTTGYFFVDNSVQVNGRTLSADFGPVAMVQ